MAKRKVTADKSSNGNSKDTIGVSFSRGIDPLPQDYEAVKEELRNDKGNLALQEKLLSIKAQHPHLKDPEMDFSLAYHSRVSFNDVGTRPWFTV